MQGTWVWSLIQIQHISEQLSPQAVTTLVQELRSPCHTIRRHNQSFWVPQQRPNQPKKKIKKKKTEIRQIQRKIGQHN